MGVNIYQFYRLVLGFDWEVVEQRAMTITLKPKSRFQDPAIWKYELEL